MKKLYVEGQSVEVSDEVFVVYTQGGRKMRYMEQDLKTEKIIIDPIKRVTKVIPSREDSLERLIDENKQELADEQDSIEKIVEQKILFEQISICLEYLKPEEKELIDLLFFSEVSERKLAELTGIPRKTISYRKEKILAKLRNIMNL
jgi:RNA polymerase sigma factor (sigma-70 family)